MHALQEVCVERGWSLVADLTETRSGRATPVGRVIADGRDALLRIDVTPASADAYLAFSDSKVTPEVYESGANDARPWLLVEWVAGTSVFEAALADPGSALDVLRNAAGAVAAAVLDLPRLAAPRSASTEFAGEVRAIEAHLVVEGQLAGSAPELHRLDSDWEPAVRLHGDVTPPNVILDGSGRARLIDVTGDWGPIERSIAQWAAALIIAAQVREDPSDTFDDYARDAVTLCGDVCDATPSLDRARLHRWTAEQLCRAAWEMSCSGADFLQWRTTAAVAGSVWRARPVSRSTKVPRNAPCPCGSGRKSKACCAR